MSDNDPNVIAPKAAPLSHTATVQRRNAADFLDWRFIALGVTVIGVVAFALLWNPEQRATAQTDRTSSSPSETSTPAETAGGSSREQLAPFAAAQRDLARNKAQDALAVFVERQIQLQDNMQVDTWGGEALRAALDAAQQGDSLFVDKRFDESIAAYNTASDKLGEIIAEGDALFAQRLAAATAAIDARDLEQAESLLSAAASIKPDEVQAVRTRLDVLPQIISLLRTAKNHELSARYNEALASYDQVEQLDPATPGLAELRADISRAVGQEDLTSYISRGFAALDAKRFDRARSAFRSALQLDPNNAIAKGGLQQVDEQNDLSLIAAFRAQATTALAEERWLDARDAYDEVITIDPNLRFAVDGRDSALQHDKTMNLLTRITAEPYRLASEKLYVEATNIQQRATTLEHAGPKLNELSAQVAQLLLQYRDPVDVLLRSDNATDIIVSNVGRLGTFAEKTLSLRPGRYTIRGSQHGCKDIFLTIDVLPGIDALDLSCPERL
ncbi:MAG: tetratricopeptide repeat protein [Pseudomonadota bacterium]